MRAFRFAFVGLSGVFVNLCCTWVAYTWLFQTWPETGRHGAALLTGIGVSIATNYLLNARWTWSDRSASLHGRWHRFYRFAVVALAAAAVQFGLAMTLALLLNQAYLLAQAIGIALASTLNFVANNAWTFRSRGQPSDASPVPTGPLAPSFR
ncbi:MAG: putative flippase GtrA [Planctomycetota bacterium]